MRKNVLIVNFNTQKLTEACIMSVNKHTPGCDIYIFDNSDKNPFVNTFANVTVLDNTHGNIIDFEKWLENYPKRTKSMEATGIFGSAKHCYTVEKCMTIIQDGFVLLDSDTLVRSDISGLFDPSVAYVGDVQPERGARDVLRVLPFVCYINASMCLDNGVHFFDDRMMHGLNTSRQCERYDTGAAFYTNVNEHRLPYKKINHKEYIIHLKGGSWEDKRRGKENPDPDKWLDKYAELFNDIPVAAVTISNPIHEQHPEPPKTASPARRGRRIFLRRSFENRIS